MTYLTHTNIRGICVLCTIYMYEVYDEDDVSAHGQPTEYIHYKPTLNNKIISIKIGHVTIV